MIPSDRHHTFEKIRNFRDFGGYPTRDGRRVRKGRLYRSAHLAEASASDLSTLETLGPRTVADLRRSEERRREPNLYPRADDGRLAPGEVCVIAVEDDFTGEPPWLAFLRSGDFSERAVRDFMIETYRALPFDERHLQLYRDWLLRLAAEPAPALIHCAAGKDRTGFGAAITLDLLGVDWADISADYLATNRVLADHALIESFRRRLRTAGVETVTEEAIFLFAGVHMDYLDAAFAAVHERHGSIAAYVRDGLGVPANAVERLRDHLCETRA